MKAHLDHYSPGSITKHTPGPWIETDRETALALPHRFICDCGNAGVVTRETGHLVNREDGPANARLIAAAPELLEALQGILGALNQPVTRRLRKENSIFDGDMHVIEHFAQSAIAKAEGKAGAQ